MNLPTLEKTWMMDSTRPKVEKVTADSPDHEALIVNFPPLKCRTGVSCVKQEVESDSVYCFQKRLNKGGFSEVWLAKYPHGFKEEPVAIKMLSKSLCPTDVILNEVEILRSVQHSPFLVQMISCFQTATHYGIVMKFATRGTLHERVKVVRCFSELVTRFYAVEIAEGLFFLHNMGIIHRDLNLDNVLVCENGHVVLSDFGLSIHLDLEDIDKPCDPWLDGPGQPQFPSPELFLGLKFDKTVDWWAYGVMLYRMVCGGFPFVKSMKLSQDSRAYNLQMVYRPEVYPNHLSIPAKQLISRLLARRRDKRLGSGKMEEDDVTSMPFFYHVDWSRVRDLSVPAPFSDLLDSRATSKHKGKQLMTLAQSYLGSMDAMDMEKAYGALVKTLRSSTQEQAEQQQQQQQQQSGAAKDKCLTRMVTCLARSLCLRSRIYSH